MIRFSIYLFLLISNLRADQLRTVIANLENHTGTALQVKCSLPTNKIIDLLRRFDGEGFVLKSFSSLDDVGDYIPEHYTYRFTITCNGFRKDGASFREESGGFAETPQQAISKAREIFSKLKDGLMDGEKLEIQKIVVFHEKLAEESRKVK